MDKAKIKDYATTLALAAIPVIIAYQAEIGKYVPVEYALAFTILMGILSQWATNNRVKIAEATMPINQAIDKAQEEVEEVSQKIDEVQEKVEQLPIDEEGSA